MYLFMIHHLKLLQTSLASQAGHFNTQDHVAHSHLVGYWPLVLCRLSCQPRSTPEYMSRQTDSKVRFNEPQGEDDRYNLEDEP